MNTSDSKSKENLKEDLNNNDDGKFYQDLKKANKIVNKKSFCLQF